MVQEIALVAALGHYNVIGKDGDIPWRCKDDLKFFMQLTKGHVVIMGRKTWDSLPKKPLKNRINVVVSAQIPDGIAPWQHVNGLIVQTNSYEKALKAAEDVAQAFDKKIFVIGGASAYNYFLPHASELYLTFVDYNEEGDTYFPEYNHRHWYVEDLLVGYPDDRNSQSFVTQRLYKKKPKETNEQDPRS